MRQSSVFILLLCVSSALATVEVATKCPDGWKWFKRSRGGWCMKVFAEMITLEDAQAKCKTEGAVVAGTQNLDELNWMADTVQTLQPSSVSIWIGATRTNACKDVRITAECTALSSFYWTDGSVVGVSGFKWQPGEPNNTGLGQACVQLYIDKKLMDDVVCSGHKLGGYACGKIASF
ncbi:hypothetical protein CAEBREN_22240 [Caenorhabditis brenneri]|uniref:C-type lectin domain-containing protein n=1 Tax=Caenorhabditis brenneri TaxID=135651 RepID=G0PAD7_CAEBE|nr:hypothetical protein CAEBREN_22240 [Caenorhabditis brenneri]